jgi:RNA polymerase sigma factor (sigma-70 family)
VAGLGAVRHVRRFENEGAFWSWLTVLARTAFIDEQRKRGRYLALLERFFRRVPDNSPEAREAEEHLRWCLSEAMNRLEVNERDLVERKYVKGESVAEIGRATEVTPKAIESRLTRVWQKLKQQILALLNDETV